ncbi:MAG: zinc ribbon-containing protein [Amphritea sp.]
MSDKRDTAPDRSAEYDRVLNRLRQNLENAEYKSWDYLQSRIEEAVELELTAEEMTRDEMDLLSAYLKRDMKRLGYYAHETGEGIAAWLSFDLNILEKKVAKQLMDMADRTRIGITELELRLEQGEDQYVVGEVAAAGTLTCVKCGENVSLKQTSRIEPCHRCGSDSFVRLSAPWASQEGEE